MKKLFIPIICLLLLIFTLSQTFSHDLRIDPSAFTILDNLCQGVITNKNTPGVCLLIGNCELEDDFIVYQKTYGKRNETETLTLDTLYDLASVTKCTFTTMAAMFLINDGIISDEDFVSQYISGFEQQSKGDVKIKHLLTHTSGLPAYTSTTDLPAGPNPDALIGKICAMAKTYTTGQSYVYSCLNFITLARVVENVTKECMHDFLKRKLWDQIGMIDSTSFPSSSQITRTAPTVANTARRGMVHDPLAYYYTDYTAKAHACGNAGGFSTVLDISRLARLLLHEGKLYNKQLLSADSVRKITTKQTTVADRTYGWAVMSGSSYTNPQNNTPETCCLGHSGYTGTYVYIDKYSKTYIIIFTNCVYPTDSDANRNAIGTLRQKIIRSVLDHLDIYNDVGQDAFVVDNDNGSPTYTESGTWNTSTQTGYMSKTYRYASVGSDSYDDYNLNIPKNGKYKISVWYRAATDKSTSAKYIINHKNGAASVYVNQQQNDAKWVSLGMYDFNKGNNIIRIDVKGSSGGTYVAADAIMADCIADETEIVVDNSDGGYIDTSNFFSSSASPYRYGADYRACNPMLGQSATWTVNFANRGVWKIFEWHNGNETRSSKVPFIIKHCWGENTILVNEQINSGKWNSIGKYVFKKGNSQISLNSVADGIVIADAVKARPIIFEKIVDNLDANYSDTSGFFASSQSPLRYDATYRACLTGAGNFAQWNLNLPYKGVWEIFEWHNGNETRSPDAPFTITHTGGDSIILVNQQINSGQWNSIGQYYFDENSGSVKLNADCSGSYIIADAIKAVYIQPFWSISGLFVH